MTEPDNFEEDLFADLYTEDEVPKPAAPETEARSKPAALANSNGVEAEELPEQNGEDGEQMHNGEQEDMDDEIDFNLGGNDNSYDAPASHESHGPGIKEDG